MILAYLFLGLFLFAALAGLVRLAARA